MLNELLNRLLGEPSPAPLPPDDCRLALTALMIRVAKADHDFAPEEQARILEILQTRYDLGAGAADKIFAEATELEEKTGDHVRLTRLIKDTVPYEDRTKVVEALWDIALADGARTDEENAFLRLVVSLIGVNDQDSALGAPAGAGRKLNLGHRHNLSAPKVSH